MNEDSHVDKFQRPAVLVSRRGNVRVLSSNEQSKSHFRWSIGRSYGYSGRIWDRRFKTPATRKQIFFWVWDRLTIILWAGLCCIALFALFITK
jgi:hypothetical protein